MDAKFTKEEREAIIEAGHKPGVGPGKGFQPGNKMASLRKKETVQLQQIKNKLFDIGPAAVETIKILLDSKNQKIQLGAAKLVLQHLVPQQVFSMSWRKIVREDGGELKNALPALQEFIEWKARQDLEREKQKDVIDVSPQKDGSNGQQRYTL